MKIDTIHNMVEKVLENVPASRDSDELLYTLVVTDLLADKNVDINKLSFTTFLKNRKYYKLPSIESVGRARRKCQELREDLKSSDVVSYYKDEQEKEYREYARRKHYE